MEAEHSKANISHHVEDIAASVMGRVHNPSWFLSYDNVAARLMDHNELINHQSGREEKEKER